MMIQTIDGRGKTIGDILKSLNRPSQLEADKERKTVLSITKRCVEGRGCGPSEIYQAF